MNLTIGEFEEVGMTIKEVARDDATHTCSVFRRLYTQKLVDQLLVDEEAKLAATQKLIEEEENIRKSTIFSYEKLCLLEDLHTAHLSRQPTATHTFPCPSNECNGLIDQGTCGVCGMTVCETCREEKKEDHECNRDTLATVDLLEASTRPCPRCKTKIFKIDGCDQMFCTKCHTAFSWQTGTIETTLIHNPHYLEWRRTLTPDGEIERHPDDIQERLSRVLVALDPARYVNGYELYMLRSRQLIEESRYASATPTCDDDC